MPLESKKLSDTSRWMHLEVQELRLFKATPRGHQKEFVLPDELKEKRDVIFKDLYEGLLGYREAGVFSKSEEFSLKLDVKLADGYVIEFEK